MNPETRQSCDTIAKTSMKQVIRLESLSEEMRILYVAMTRAKDRLILTGSVRDLSGTAGKWAKPISPYSLSRGLNYLDWIGPILMRHPDCSALRNLLDDDLDQPLWEHDSSWQVEFHGRGEVTAFHREEAKTRNEFLARLKNPEKTISEIIQKGKRKTAAVVDDYKETTEIRELKINEEDEVVKEAIRLREMIDERFSWDYPYGYAINIPSKMTVTEIRKLGSGNEPSVPSLINPSPSLRARPRFLEGSKRFSAAEKGTIVHFILQHLNLNKVVTKDDILLQIENMIKCELLTEEEAQAANMNQILGFLNSEIGHRIRNASRVHREVPFNLRKKAHELLDDLQPNEDTLLIQGVIDCFFEEEGEWILVDYKTDYVNSGEKLLLLKERYRIQMDLYSEALEQITGKPVKERILYLLSINQAVQMR